MPMPWTVADTAPLIESVEIADQPRQRTVALLIEDFGWDWQRLVAIHASRMAAPRGDDSAWKQAHRAAEKEARRIKELRASMAGASPYEAARTRARIKRREQSAETLRAAVVDARQRLHDRRNATDHTERLRAFQTDAAALHQELIENIRVILLDTELDDFESFTQRMVRRRRLEANWIEGEGLDLDALIISMRPPLSVAAVERIEPTLAAWRAEVDTAMDTRDAADAALAEASAERPVHAADIHAARLDASRAVRDCTLAYLAALQNAVDDERDDLYHTAMKRAFPRYFRPTDAMVAIRWCLDQEDIKDVRLAALLRQHEQRIGEARQRGFDTFLRQDGLGHLRSLGVASGIAAADQSIESTDRSTDEAVQAETQRALAMLRSIIGWEAVEDAVSRGRSTAR